MRGRLRLVSMVLALSVCVCVGMAQDAKHEAQLRTVRGVVVDKSSESPIPSAVVFLKNTRTNAVRSYIADDEDDEEEEKEIAENGDLPEDEEDDDEEEDEE